MTLGETQLPLEIGVDELATMRAAGVAHTILDVREPWEIEICGFEGALEVPLGSLPGRLAEIPGEHPLIVVCHVGQRSLLAADWLRRADHPTARSLRGGVEAWALEIDPEMPRY
jgi:rhodanese-related sulfurtransferase